jgi:hypothetical protein
MRMRNALATLLVPFALLAACNDTPAESIDDKLELLVKEVLTSDSRIKIDFLWVVDNSSSMCQEQNALARDFKVFIDQLETFSNIDYRLAVTTTDVRTKGFKGAFRNSPATEYGPACQLNVIRECTVDSQCAYLKTDYGPMWECSWEGSALTLTVNDNGTVNSSCHKGCDDNLDCTSAFGDTYECSLKTTGAVGCLEPPQVQGCPGDLKKVLSPTDFEDFYCIATVGAEGTSASNIEAGLKAGWMALERPEDMCRSESPNTCDLYAGLAIENKLAWIPTELAKVEKAIAANPDAGKLAQYEAYQDYLTDCRDMLKKCSYFISPAEPNFLRDDAYLVVLYVTDEDDCSDRDDNPLSLNQTKLCAFQTENLIPIKDLVSSYRSLKSDPAKVIVVGIVGDGLTDGSDSCLMSDECIYVRTLDQCSCYKAGADKSACPELLKGAQNVAPHATMCNAPCELDPDPEARKTEWCLADPPTDWCDARTGERAVQKPDTSNCFLLEDILAAYDKKIAQIEGWAEINPDELDTTQELCVNLLTTFRDERSVVQAAADKCAPKLAEELAYRLQCLDECLGKGEYNPLRKCSKLNIPERSAPEAIDFCRCYDHDEAGKLVNADKAECKEAFADEPTYRLACKRECFISSKIVSAVQPKTAPHVCSSANGVADFGSRYVDFISRFGRNGILANICAAGGVGRSLEEIATSILPIIFRVCIPKAPEDAAHMRVLRTSIDGDQNELTQGKESDYELVPDSQCPGTGQAIIFHPVPAPSDKVEIYFNAATKTAE